MIHVLGAPFGAFALQDVVARSPLLSGVHPLLLSSVHPLLLSGVHPLLLSAESRPHELQGLDP